MVPKLLIFIYFVVIFMIILAAILDFRGIYYTYILFYDFKAFPDTISIQIDIKNIKIEQIVQKL